MSDIEEYLAEFNDIFEEQKITEEISSRLSFTINSISIQLGYELYYEDYDTG